MLQEYITIFFSPENCLALLTLTFLEIILGIDNIIFISVVSNKLSQKDGLRARNIGLSAALIFRIILLLSLGWVINFTNPLFTLFGYSFSFRDLILLAGGLFLITKSTTEIHCKVQGKEKSVKKLGSKSFLQAILQITLLDIIFSFDSILTAIGLTKNITLMIISVVIAMIIMMIFSGKISAFLQKNPTLEVLALSFLILIGFMLILDSFDFHVPKGYIYFAVFFSLAVEVLNVKIIRRIPPKL